MLGSLFLSSVTMWYYRSHGFSGLIDAPSIESDLYLSIGNNQVFTRSNESEISNFSRVMFTVLVKYVNYHRPGCPLFSPTINLIIGEDKINALEDSLIFTEKTTLVYTCITREQN